jgi:hypothetical protein
MDWRDGEHGCLSPMMVELAARKGEVDIALTLFYL